MSLEYSGGGFLIFFFVPVQTIPAAPKFSRDCQGAGDYQKYNQLSSILFAIIHSSRERYLNDVATPDGITRPLSSPNGIGRDRPLVFPLRKLVRRAPWTIVISAAVAALDESTSELDIAVSPNATAAAIAQFSTADYRRYARLVGELKYYTLPAILAGVAHAVGTEYAFARVLADSLLQPTALAYLRDANPYSTVSRATIAVPRARLPDARTALDVLITEHVHRR